MLKILMPLVGLFYNYNMNKNLYWLYQSFTMLMSIMIFIMMFSSSSSLMMKSYWFMGDNMSNSLTLLTLYISSMMIMSSNKIYLLNLKMNMFITTVSMLNLVLILCFNLSSIMLFYFTFETSLIPTMMLIMIWGYQPERLKASFYLMIYTITASLPMLVLFMSTMMLSKSSLMMKYMIFINLNTSKIMWFMFIIGFMVKLPMYITHLWLPKAHVEAPVAGSMVLAAILLKLGGYGAIRMMSLSPWSNMIISSWIISLSLIGSIITSMICIRQHDLKSLIAYSSVSHMGLLICGLMTSTKMGVYGSVMIMIAHGLTSSALFILANINYDLISSRSVLLSKNVLTLIPMLSLWWFMFSIINMSAPPSINLMSEILINMSILYKSSFNMLFISFIMFFTGVYSLIMYTSLNHGNSNMYMNVYYNMTTPMKNLLMMHLLPIILIICKLEYIMY